MKKIISKIYAMSYVFLGSLLIAGCKGGGGGSGSSSLLSGISEGGASGTEGTILDGATTIVETTSLATIHNPEPSTILLFSSGLIGMAIYARARLKGKGRK